MARGSRSAAAAALLGSLGKFLNIAQGADVISTPNGLANSPVENPRSLVEIQAGQENSKATIRVGIDSSPAVRAADIERWHVLSSNWSVTGSAPVGSGSDPTQVATLDGLADAAQLALKSQWVIGKDRNATPEERKPFEQEMQALVDKTNVDLKTRTEVDRKKQLERLQNLGCKVEADKLVYHNGTNEADCLLSASRAQQYRQVLLGKVSALFIPGLSATVGSKSYKFLDPLSDKSSTVTKTPWSTQAFLGLHWYQSLVTVGYHYDAAYKDATSGSLCPAPTGALTTCKTGPLGRPPRNEQSVVFLEYRHRLPEGALSVPVLRSLAFAPLVSYDTRKSVFGISLPLYLVPDANGKLTGGISVGWRDDKGGLQVSAIVSSAFSAYPSH